MDVDGDERGLAALDQHVMMDDRLAGTEGLAVDYEWLDVNNGDLGKPCGCKNAP